MFQETKNNEIELFNAAATGNLSECKRLIEKERVNIDAFGMSSQRTALHWAAAEGHVDVVRYLLEQNAQLILDWSDEVFTKIPEIRRLLHYHFETKTHLFHRPVINESDFNFYGYDYAHLEAKIKNEVMFCRSLEKFKKIMDKYHLRADSYICGIPLLDIASWINIANTAHDRLNMKRYNDVTQYLLQEGANPNLKCHPSRFDTYESTSLHLLLANEWVEKAAMLINNAIKFDIAIDLTIRDIERKTVLHMGALLRETTFLELCLTKVGNLAIDLQDDNGHTPLHHAYLLGDLNSINLLKEHGANQEIEDNKNRKPAQMLSEPVDEIKKALKRFHIDPARPSKINPSESILKECVRNRLSVLKSMSESKTLSI